MSTIVYITKQNGEMETRTFFDGNASHQKELTYLMVRLATGNPYKRVTIERIDG